MTTPKPFCLANKESKLITKEDNVTTTHYVYYDGDIKQAVQLLKEEIEWCNSGKPKIGMITMEQIDKIFGEALTNG